MIPPYRDFADWQDSVLNRQTGLDIYPNRPIEWKTENGTSYHVGASMIGWIESSEDKIQSIIEEQTHEKRALPADYQFGDEEPYLGVCEENEDTSDVQYFLEQRKVEGALRTLTDDTEYRPGDYTLYVLENAGGILQGPSGYIFIAKNFDHPDSLSL